MLLELLEGTVSTSANGLALVSAKKVWTYADLGNAVEAVSYTHLRAHET